jgi:hypothetical protein
MGSAAVSPAGFALADTQSLDGAVRRLLELHAGENLFSGTIAYPVTCRPSRLEKANEYAAS